MNQRKLLYHLLGSLLFILFCSFELRICWIFVGREKSFLVRLFWLKWIRIINYLFCAWYLGFFFFSTIIISMPKQSHFALNLITTLIKSPSPVHALQIHCFYNTQKRGMQKGQNHMLSLQGNLVSLNTPICGLPPLSFFPLFLLSLSQKEVATALGFFFSLHIIANPVHQTSNLGLLKTPTKCCCCCCWNHLKRSCGNSEYIYIFL